MSPDYTIRKIKKIEEAAGKLAAFPYCRRNKPDCRPSDICYLCVQSGFIGSVTEYGDIERMFPTIDETIAALSRYNYSSRAGCKYYYLRPRDNSDYTGLVYRVLVEEEKQGG